LYTNGSAGTIINTNPPAATNTGYLDDSLDFFPGANEFESFYDAGDPTVLTKFENQSFTFQLYNSSNNFVQNLAAINTSEFEWLDFISLKNEPQGAHPTFEWDDVQNAQEYRIRIFRETEPVLLFNQTFNAGQGSYSYQYMGDLFNQYDDAYIRLEARNISGGTGNRSIVFYNNPVLATVFFNWAEIWSENRYYESSNTSEYGMVGDTGVSTNAYDVFMYIPSWTGYEYQKLSPYNYLGSYGAGKFFTTADGYPSPGAAYEARDIYFFIDENGSGEKDSSDPSAYRYYQSGRFSQLPLVTNVKTYYSGSDVIVSWDGIPLVGDFGDDGNDQYRVRIIDKATTEFYFDSGMIAINSSNKYVYNLGNLSAYGGNFWIAIEAREIIESQGMGLANRSRYYAEPNSKPKAQAMPWIPLLLLDD
jgi:hypothetical protein